MKRTYDLKKNAGTMPTGAGQWGAVPEKTPTAARDSRGNNCRVLGCDANDADFVKVMTPTDTKRLEYDNDPMYATTRNQGDLDVKRSRETAAARTQNVRPLGGGARKT